MTRYLVFATPRSGSSFALRAIAHYLKLTEGTGSLGEFLNFQDNWYRESHSGIDRVLEPEPKSVELALEDRLFLLQKYFGRHCFKLFPYMSVPGGMLPMPPESLEYFQKGFEWIFVERADRWEQALSFAISWTTRIFYQEGEIRLPEGSLEFDPECFSVLAKYLEEYQRIKDLYLARGARARLLEFERMVSAGTPLDWLSEIGFDKKVGFEGFVPTRRQNPGDKLSYFRDPGLVRETFRSKIGKS